MVDREHERPFRSRKFLFLSTPVGPLGSGLGGGVELTLHNLASELQRRGHRIQIVAPAGSVLPGFDLQEIPGNPQIPAQTVDRNEPIALPRSSVLAAMWNYTRQVQAEWDLLVNFAYDWLPLYLTPFFQRPIAHLISMASLSEAFDQMAGQVALTHPGTLGVHTQAQADTFPFAASCRVLGNAIDGTLYRFVAEPENALAWVGRISPEKGLEDAMAASRQARIPLRIFGKMQDREYWDRIRREYPDAPCEYRGFVSSDELQREVGQCRALLMTPRWIEAFGNVAIEALACGVPVIAYRRGGPKEIVRDGQTGFLVEPDSVSGLVAAIERCGHLDRRACRRQAETEFALPAWADRFEAWFTEILSRS